MKRNAGIGIFYKAITIWEKDVEGYIPSRGGQALRSDPLYQALDTPLLLSLHRDDVVFSIRAYIDDAILSRFRRNLMHRRSFRAEITARLQDLDVILARHMVLWLTLDYHSSEG